MKKRALLILFIAAFMVSLIEAVYLFNYATKSSSNSDVPQTRSVPRGNAVNSTGQERTHAALNDSYWEYLREFDRENLKSIEANILCKGIIDIVNITPGVNPTDNQRYEKLLRLEETTKYCEFVLLDQFLIKTLTIIDKTNGQNKEITFEELQKGDRVEVLTVMSLLSPVTEEDSVNLIKTIITKY